MRIFLMLFLSTLTTLALADESYSSADTTDESILEKTLEKEEASAQKFAELVKSTMELMGPEEELLKEEDKTNVSTP